MKSNQNYIWLKVQLIASTSSLERSSRRRHLMGGMWQLLLLWRCGPHFEIQLSSFIFSFFLFVNAHGRDVTTLAALEVQARRWNTKTDVGNILPNSLKPPPPTFLICILEIVHVIHMWPSWLPYSTYLYLDFHLLCSMTKLKEHSREIC